VQKNTWKFGIALCGAVLAVSLLSAAAWAQTSKLTPGDQKIVQALFEAQKTAKPGTQPLTREQIVAMKSQQGWGEAFKDMKSKGLVTQKNLGQVVSEFERRHPTTAKVDPKPDKTEKVEKPAKPERMEKPERAEKPGR
jgi:hypothetical protein